MTILFKWLDPSNCFKHGNDQAEVFLQLFLNEIGYIYMVFFIGRIKRRKCTLVYNTFELKNKASMYCFHYRSWRYLNILNMTCQIISTRDSYITSKATWSDIDRGLIPHFDMFIIWYVLTYELGCDIAFKQSLIMHLHCTKKNIF